MQFKCEDLMVKNSDKVLILLGINGKKINKINFKELTQKYKFIIINGNLEKDLIFIKNIINKNIKYVFSDKDYFYIKNNYYKFLKEKWIKNIPNIIKIEFSNQTTCLVCNVGVCNREDLNNNYNVTFNTSDWIKKYDGSYGWIISNFPLLPETSHTTNFSVQNFINYSESRAWGQEVSGAGLGNKIFFQF